MFVYISKITYICATFWDVGDFFCKMLFILTVNIVSEKDDQVLREHI